MTDWKKLPFEASAEIRVGISSCLLGEEVRVNGGHAHDSFITSVLGQYFSWVPIYPEVDIGMGTQRETIRLENENDSIHLRAPKSGTDYTEKIKSYADERIVHLSEQPLHGYILKKYSPSCGMERVRVYDENDVPTRTGRGVFARALMEKFPLLPVEEEGRLRYAHFRENFVERVFAYYRLQQFLSATPQPGELVEFHTRHKLTLMAHHQDRYRELGRIAAKAGTGDFTVLLDEYSSFFMETMAIPATAKNHTNVLQHALGYFRQYLDSPDRQEMADYISDYRSGSVPLIVPITMMKHHLRKYPIKWLEKQVYFHPYPPELKLWNPI
ncbi:MAG: DUF523 and DUF1722 domain-containing protein [Candidatus Marinimicrobia bacterium]|nr:DUF523 and DUF1722 domain-containing protein [Candidatus Neomarinimicrobiota bacterium]MCF7829318.1 DUF523 and DUF1722 domain-containing protein [Candidatus Neomarinimicrobiota bacterium]MCF7880020.1 DUF523 and DUF1722 domain-containing protein [Candidatus Neomarinimicrobiota bacterium]